MPRYRLSLEQDDNGTVLVTSPDLPLATFGETEADAIENAHDVAVTLLQSIIDIEDDVPPGFRSVGELVLQLALPVELKIALYSALRSTRRSRDDLQKKLGWSRLAVDPLFQLRRRTRLEDLSTALAALDQVIEISVVNRDNAAVAA